MASEKSNRNLHRNVWSVTLTSFFNDISSEMILNLLPLFLYNILGVRTGIIGLIEGISETTASLLKLFSGWISDRLRMRKPLAVLGYGLSTLAKPFLYAASTWGWVLGVRFADRVGKGIRTAPRDALLADSVSEKRRGLAFGLHRAGDTAGAVIGLGVALAVILAAEKKAIPFDRETFQTIVLLSLIPAGLAVLIIALTAVETKVDKERKAPGLTLAGLSPSFRWFLLVMVVFTLGNSSDAFLILRAENAGLSVSGILGMMITFNLVYTIASSPAGALSDKIGRKQLLTAGWIVYGLVYLGFAFASSGSQTWVLMAVYGLYYGLTEGTAKAFVADLVPSDQRGTAYGVFHAAVGITAFPASLAAGILWQGVGSWAGWGPSAPFVFGSVLSLIAIVLLHMKPATARVQEESS
ncbi:MAG: MFS transporter [Anaerolineales bacterium]|nr:MFS transporter [Anaerolineales bacterium]